MKTQISQQITKSNFNIRNFIEFSKKQTLIFPDNIITKLEGLDGSKGIFLIGKVGVGKTTLMKAISNYTLVHEKQKFFILVPMRKIYKDFATIGYEGLNLYTENIKKNNFGVEEEKPINLCIDDVGDNDVSNFYGVMINLFEEIIFSRYELFEKGIFTHATSNLDIARIKKRYSEKTLSRMREMFNFVYYDGEDRRR